MRVTTVMAHGRSAIVALLVASSLAACSRNTGATHRPEEAVVSAVMVLRPGASVNRVREVLQRAGLGLWRSPGQQWIVVTGSAPRMRRLLFPRQRPGREHGGTASSGDPTVPVSLRPWIDAAGRIVTYHPGPAARAVPGGGLSPVDLLRAYDITPLRRAGFDGAAETVVFYEFYGYQQDDLDTFAHRYHLPPLRVVTRSGDPAVDVEDETEMDLEIVHEIAPRARLVVYLETNTYHSDARTLAGLLPLQQRMVTENPGSVISESWGVCDRDWGSTNARVLAAIYGDAAHRHESVFVASGDSGAFECLNTAPSSALPGPAYVAASLPDSVPSVTSVGGTRLSVRRDGSWLDERVWEWPAYTEASGGGISRYFSRPSWQPSVPDVPATHRTTPDVSADADPVTSPRVFTTGDWKTVGGTSQAAPIWAGITALVDQYLRSKHHPVTGPLNARLYAIARHAPYPAFHDVTIGTNLWYRAGPGYDLASGLGTPDAWNLARDLAAETTR